MMFRTFAEWVATWRLRAVVVATVLVYLGMMAGRR